MENTSILENIGSILAFVLLSAILLSCILLVLYGILRWIKPPQERGKRLNVISWLAFVVLVLIFMIGSGMFEGYLNSGGEDTNDTITVVFINSSKIFIKLMILGIIAISAVMLFLFLAFCIYSAFKIFFSQKEGSPQKLKDINKKIKNVLENRFLPFILTWGILAIFIMLPLLMGRSDGSVANVWQDGVHKIATLSRKGTEALVSLPAYSDSDSPMTTYWVKKCILHFFSSGNPVISDFYTDLIKYVLIYVIVLGVGFAVLKILHSIIKNSLKEPETNSLLGEYSGSIGVLAVGVALLLSFRSIDLESMAIPEIIAECTKYFAAVFFIVALAILTLEIIRLLLDMREKLIRQQAKYLFISLVGQVALLLLGVINSIYEAASSILGQRTGNHDPIEHTQEKLKTHMAQSMQEHMDKAVPKDHETTFSSFDGQVTKK